MCVLACPQAVQAMCSPPFDPSPSIARRAPGGSASRSASTSMAAGEGTPSPSTYDLTPLVAKHLDRHLVFPLLEFLGSKGLYDAADIEAAKLQLIEKTNMVDYAVDIYQQLNQTDEARRAGRPTGPGAAAHHHRLPPPPLERGGGTRAAAAWLHSTKRSCSAITRQQCEISRAAGCSLVWHHTPPPPPLLPLTRRRNRLSSALQVPESLRARRGEVVARLKALESAVRPITEFLSNEARRGWRRGGAGAAQGLFDGGCPLERRRRGPGAGGLRPPHHPDPPRLPSRCRTTSSC